MDDDKLLFEKLSPLAKSFLAGSFSGTCSTITLQPFDLLKTKIQNAPAGKRQGMLKIAKSTVVSDGVFGLWTGLTPTLLRTVPGNIG